MEYSVLAGKILSSSVCLRNCGSMCCFCFSKLKAFMLMGVVFLLLMCTSNVVHQNSIDFKAELPAQQNFLRARSHVRPGGVKTRWLNFFFPLLTAYVCKQTCSRLRLNTCAGHSKNQAGCCFRQALPNSTHAFFRGHTAATPQLHAVHMVSLW